MGDHGDLEELRRRNQELEAQLSQRSAELAHVRLYSPHFEDGETVLCSAIMTNRKGASYVENMAVTAVQIALVEAFLDAGSDINERRGTESGMPPLGTAAWLGKLGFVELLLERGADPNTGEVWKNSSGAEVMDTALGVAAAMDGLLTVYLLLYFVSSRSKSRPAPS